MSLDMRCYTLQRWYSEKDAPGLVRHAAEAGVKIPAYSGVYSNEHYSALQVIAGGDFDEKTQHMEIRSGQIHNAGTAFWRCRVLREITPEGSSDLDMRILAETVYGKKFVTVLDVVNADILPSYAPGEIIDLQVIGKTHSVYFYRDEAQYARAEARGKSPLNCPVPSGDDGRVSLAGTILRRTWLRVEIPQEYGSDAVTNLQACRLGTCFGDIQMMVSRLQESEARAGRVLSASCSIQGDPLIAEYEYGMVISEKNNLMALRYAFSSGRVHRLLPVLSEDCVLDAGPFGGTAAGPGRVAERLAEIRGRFAGRGEMYALYGAADEGGDPEGKRCVVVGRGEEAEQNDALYVFAGTDGEGRICSLRLRGGPRRPFRRYRSWIEMEEGELVHRGVSPAALRRTKALSDYLNRTGAHDAAAAVIGFLLDEGAVLEYGERRVEGADNVLAFLENLSRAVSSDAGYTARPVFVSPDPGLDYSTVKMEKHRAVALYSKIEENEFRFLEMGEGPDTGKTVLIRSVPAREYASLIDHYVEWDPAAVSEVQEQEEGSE